MTTDSQQSELLLQADRYFAGELTSAEAANFESQLSHDVAAQQALVDVVTLRQSIVALDFSESIVVAPSQKSQLIVSRTPSKRHSWGKTNAFIAATTAIVCVAVSSFWGPSSKDSTVATSSLAEDASVVGLWAEITSQASKSETESGAEAETWLDTTSDSEIDVPDWMFAAVQFSDIADDMEMMDDEEGRL